jgi:uncharacterized RmlC-like cupin family protein
MVVRSGSAYEGRQGLTYFAGLTGESAGSTGLCMTVARLPPGARSRAHRHRGVESAGYVIAGAVETWYGERLEDCARAQAGDLVYIPCDLPHVVVNASDAEATVLVAHTAADDQHGIELLPELDELPRTNN